MRAEYARDGLEEVGAGLEPIGLFRSWFDDAVSAGLHEPNAMALASSTPDGAPSVRIVLLKHLDEDGAVFFTSYESRKGVEIQANPRVAAVLLWHPLQRQVRVEGAVSRVSAKESDAYFASRPLGSRVSAAASPQSSVVPDRDDLEQRVARVRDQAGADGPARPPEWGGYRIALESVEFWQGRENRLHDRIRFVRVADEWRRERLAP